MLPKIGGFFGFFASGQSMCRSRSGSGESIGRARMFVVMDQQESKKNSQAVLESIQECTGIFFICLSVYVFPSNSHVAVYSIPSSISFDVTLQFSVLEILHSSHRNVTLHVL